MPGRRARRRASARARPSGRRSPPRRAPARRRSASAVARAYSQRFASAATQRILPRSEGPSGLCVRCRRSRSSIAAVVRGRSRAVALAQAGSLAPPPVSARGRCFHASSFDASGQPPGPSGAAGAVPASVATRDKADQCGWIMGELLAEGFGTSGGASLVASPSSSSNMISACSISPGLNPKGPRPPL